uniref:Venom protein n=1 Tax=Ampulex compressa TaxID=860918 RepID=A0A1W6EVY4_AMPCP|nr:venom protein [Ampulex compressa]
MKILISLYVLIALCEIRLTLAGGDANFGYGLDPYKKYVRNTKIDIRNKTASIRTERITSLLQVEEMLQIIRGNTLRILQEHVTTIIIKLQNSYAIATANGKAVKDCIEYSARDINEIEQVIRLNLEDCTKDIVNYYEHHEYFTSNIEKDAKAMIADLDNIFPRCQDLSTRYKCVSDAITSINLRVVKFNKSFKLHMHFFNVILDVGYTFAQACVRKSRKNTNDLIIDMLRSADTCMYNAKWLPEKHISEMIDVPFT